MHQLHVLYEKQWLDDTVRRMLAEDSSQLRIVGTLQEGLGHNVFTPKLVCFGKDAKLNVLPPLVQLSSKPSWKTPASKGCTPSSWTRFCMR